MSQPVADTAQQTTKTAPATVEILVGDRLEFSTQLKSTLELGRQQAGEAEPYTLVADRVIIASLAETGFSRRHVLLRLLPDEKVRVTNQSAVNTISVGSDEKIQPGAHRDVDLPTKIVLFDRAIKIEAIREQPGQGTLSSLPHQTLAPGQLSGQYDSFADVLPSDQSEEETRYLLRGLHATIGVFQLATRASDFMSSAAQAVIDVVGLESAAALTWDGSDWQVAAHCTTGGESNQSRAWEASRTMLQRVRDEKRTFWQLPGFDDSRPTSLDDVKVLVAAPILNRKAEVVGALYGDRRWATSDADGLGISETSAVLVELLATSVAAGLARLDQEQAAVKARVLFEQFFTVELSRELEARPDLLLAKDTEVTLLFCDIRGLSEVSEKLGARLTLDWINDVMSTLNECVTEHQGVFVDTVGDEVTAMWGAPVARTDHADLACRAAIAMLEKVPALNRRWHNALERPIDLGIGIHTGMARVGNIGSAKKFQYGPLGSPVSLARRAKNATKPLMAKILITGSTVEKLQSEFATRRLCRVARDASESTIDLHELAVQVPDDWAELSQRYESALESFERDDLPTATRLLAKILADHPNDRASLELLSRINGKLSPTGWSF